jgi:hypothetical protein
LTEELRFDRDKSDFLNIITNWKEKEKKMNLIKVIWRLALCALFFIGVTYSLPAYATEPEGHEKAAHETHESTEAVEQEEGEAAEEAQATEAEEKAHGEEETHETEKGDD